MNCQLKFPSSVNDLHKSNSFLSQKNLLQTQPAMNILLDHEITKDLQYQWLFHRFYHSYSYLWLMRNGHLKLIESSKENDSKKFHWKRTLTFQRLALMYYELLMHQTSLLDIHQSAKNVASPTTISRIRDFP